MLSGYKGHNIIFIVGCPRSGTTWLQRLLASHPRIQTGQESDLFDQYIGPQLRSWRRDLDIKSSGRSIGLGCYLNENEFICLLRDFMLHLLQPMVGGLKPNEIFIEKTPSHALYLDEIIELLPDCRIIHMVRDARDVVASLLAAVRTWGVKWAPHNAKVAAHLWIDHVRAVRESSKRLLNHQFYTLRYEDLKKDTARCLQEVSQFMELEWDAVSLLNAIEKNQPDMIKSGGGTVIPLKGEYSKKIGRIAKEPVDFVRKAKIGSWRDELTWKQKLQVWKIIHKEMGVWGYHWKFPL